MRLLNELTSITLSDKFAAPPPVFLSRRRHSPLDKDGSDTATAPPTPTAGGGGSGG